MGGPPSPRAAARRAIAASVSPCRRLPLFAAAAAAPRRRAASSPAPASTLRQLMEGQQILQRRPDRVLDDATQPSMPAAAADKAAELAAQRLFEQLKMFQKRKVPPSRATGSANRSG